MCFSPILNLKISKQPHKRLWAWIPKNPFQLMSIFLSLNLIRTANDSEIWHKEPNWNFKDILKVSSCFDKDTSK